MWQSTASHPAIGPSLKRDYPEVEDFCRIKDDPMLLSNDAKGMKFSETKGYYADSASISILGIELMQGPSTGFLKHPDEIIISQGMAKKYFGAEDVIGKVLIARRQNSMRHCR